MTTNELRACPFCGKKRHLRFEPFEGSTDTGIVVCICGASYTTIEQGADWNTRPIEDALHTRIAELEGENKKAFDFVKTLRSYCIYAHWDNPDTEDEFNEFDAEICKWLSEFTEREE